ncbi:MAG: hypothetical protein QJR00_04875 [Bacillota bacterium]|nr:hypothetical protein [Bacillota bacterium]
MRPGIRELTLIGLWALAVGTLVGLFLKALGIHDFWVLLSYPLTMRLMGDRAAAHLPPGQNLRTLRPAGDQLLATLYWGFPLAVLQRLLASSFAPGPWLLLLTSPLPAAIAYLVDLYPRWREDIARASLADRLRSWP